MATVGEILKKARLEQKIEFTEVERKTKIRSAFIEALEKGEYHRLPAPTYARGFLTNYARFLGLNTETLLALFRREFNPEPDNKLLPAGLGKVSTRRIRVTSLVLLLIILMFLFLFYFFFQYKGFLSGPTLQVNSPSESEIIQSESVRVAGKTDFDAQLFINNKVVAVSADGSFDESIPVFRGDFTITVISKNRFGKENKIIRIVKVKGP